MLKEMVDKIGEEQRQRRLHTEGHRRRRAALPREGGNNGREAGQEERHGEARQGDRREAGHEPGRPDREATSASPGLVEERKISGEQMVFVEKCKDPKSVTIFVRGGTKQVVDEAERAITDEIGALISALEVGKYVYGGGSTEEYSREGPARVREQRRRQGAARHTGVRGRAGGDTEDAGGQRRNGRHRHPGAAEEQAEGQGRQGLRGRRLQGGDQETWSKLGVIEPVKIKQQAISSATEATRPDTEDRRHDKLQGQGSRPRSGRPRRNDAGRDGRGMIPFRQRLPSFFVSI